MAGNKINLPLSKIGIIKKKFRTSTMDVVKFTEVKANDDIYGVASTLTSGITALEDVEFFWQDNMNLRVGEGGNIQEGRAIAVMNFTDKNTLSGENVIIRKDSTDFRINKIQEFPDTDEIILNLEKITSN